MLLLAKDHTIKRISDETVTKKELEEAKYLLIDTSVERTKLSKNYVMIDPKLIPYFTKAKIRYQLVFIYTSYEAEICDFEPIPPVETETRSFSNVINLLNCIDRLYIPNMLIENDEFLYSYDRIAIGYFEVYLYDGKKKVYHSLYRNKYLDDDKKFQKKYYDKDDPNFPLEVVKKFRKIYNTDVIHEMIAENQLLYIYQDMRWEISINTGYTYALIGIPLLGSRTITLLNDIEFLRVAAIRKMSITYTILFVANEKQRKNNSFYISQGMYSEIGETNHDYHSISNIDLGLEHSVPYRFIYLDIISHINYAIRITNIVYTYVEGYEEAMVDYGDGIDTVVAIDIYDLYKKKKNGCRTIFLNEDTMIPLDEFLEML